MITTKAVLRAETQKKDDQETKDIENDDPETKDIKNDSPETKDIKTGDRGKVEEDSVWAKQ